MKGKKGQVNTLAPAILALVFAAIVLVFGIVMTQELRDTRDGAVSDAVTANESVTITAGVGTIAVADYCGFESFSLTQILNGTTFETLAVTTDYTADSAAGTITNVTFVTSPILVTYTFTWGGEACVAGNKTVTGLGTFADFWEIIVLAIVITIVIGLLLIIFGGSARRR